MISAVDDVNTPLCGPTNINSSVMLVWIEMEILSATLVFNRYPVPLMFRLHFFWIVHSC